IHQRTSTPLILSEHGLYTKERDLELLHSNLFTKTDNLISQNKTFSYQHIVWINFFDSLARMCYYYADTIVSLFGEARKYQILAGAEASKTIIIPNGVNIKKFAVARRPENKPIPKVVCFVGRMFRIKD